MIDYDCRDDLSISQNFYKHVHFYSPFTNSESYTLDDDDGKRVPTLRSHKYMSPFKHCVSFNTAPMRTENADEIDKKYSTEFPGVQLPKEYRRGNFLSDKYAISRFLASSLREYPISQSRSEHSSFDMDGHSGGSNFSSSFDKRSRRTEQGKKMMQMVRKFGITEEKKIVREDYPSRPSTTNDSIVISRESQEWSRFWKLRRDRYNERVDEDKFAKFFVYPEVLFKSEIDAEERLHKRQAAKWMDTDGYTPISKDTKRKIMALSEVVGSTNLPRVILCRIDGRKHTWVALDWLITMFIQGVDHIVIVTNLPAFRWSHRASKSNVSLNRHGYNSEADPRLRDDTNDGVQHNVWERVYERGYDRDMLKRTADKIWEYVETLLFIAGANRMSDNPVKVTIEITIGKTMDTMCDMINIYTPDLIVVGNMNTESLTKWKSQYFSDLVYSKYPIPVIEVPVLMMNAFEKALVREAARLGRFNNSNIEQRLVPRETVVESKQKDQQKVSVSQSSKDDTCQVYMETLDLIIKRSLKTAPKVPEISHIRRQMVDIAASPSMSSLPYTVAGIPTAGIGTPTATAMTSSSTPVDASFRQSKSSLVASATATGTTVTTRPLTSITSSQMRQMYNRSKLLSQQHAFKSSTAIPYHGPSGNRLSKVTSDPTGRPHVNAVQSNTSLPIRRVVTNTGNSSNASIDTSLSTSTGTSTGASTNTNTSTGVKTKGRTTTGTPSSLRFGWPLRRAKSDHGSERCENSITEQLLDNNDDIQPVLSEGNRRSNGMNGSNSHIRTRRSSHPLSRRSVTGRGGSILDAVESAAHTGGLGQRRWSDERRSNKSVGFFSSFFKKGKN